MSTRKIFFLVAFASAAATTCFGQDSAPAGNPPRNSASIPALSGVWAHPSIPGFEPLPSGPTSLKNRARRGQTGDNRKLVGDFTNPILKPQAAEIVKKQGELQAAGIGYPTPRNQCWPGGVPFAFETVGMQMLQQPNEVTIIYAEGDEVRHIRMNQPHPATVTPSWYGDSIGHYEGDTLVIDTVGVKVGPYAMVDWFGTPHTPAMHLVERYRLVDYAEAKEALNRDQHENFQVQPETINPDYRGKYLQLRFTVDDPGVFTTPWSATMTYRPLILEWLEDFCAENTNKYGTEKSPALPTAAKPDF